MVKLGKGIEQAGQLQNTSELEEILADNSKMLTAAASEGIIEIRH